MTDLSVGACPHCDASSAWLAEAREERDTERLRLAACGVAAMQNTPESVKERIDRDNPYWSASYGDVCAAVDREMAHRAALGAERIENAHLREAFVTMERGYNLAVAVLEGAAPATWMASADGTLLVRVRVAAWEAWVARGREP